MSSILLRFPDYETLKTNLCNHKSFKDDKYLKSKGITQVVTKLAAERFADQELDDLGVQKETMTIIFDLKRGKDGYTHQPLPKLDIDSEGVWNALSYCLTKALLASGKKDTVDKQQHPSDEKKTS